MSKAIRINDKEMWSYLAEHEHKTVDEVKAVHAHDTAEDLKELKAYVLSEKRNDAVEDAIDCYTLGVHVARLVADSLSEVCSRGEDGHLIYRGGWCDERVAQSLTEAMADLVERVREDFEGSSLIDSGQLPLSFADEFRLPALSHD